MEAVISQPSISSSGSQDAILLRIAELREKIHGHKMNALNQWNACSPVEQQIVASEKFIPTVGEHTKKLLGEQT